MLQEAASGLRSFLPLIATITLVLLALAVGERFVRRRRPIPGDARFLRQVSYLVLALLLVLVGLLMLPVSDALRGQLITLLGLIVSAVLTLASTTFFSNAMGGLLLRAMHGFRPGDFIRTGEHFGRVTERGLFHTEIQTADRDLTTLPNLYLVSHPITVVRETGTVVSATLSLGYEVPHSRVESLLVEAGERAELQEPFVQILELGDHSVTYRVAGFFTDVRNLLHARSRLRACALDALHDGGVEIVSPLFVNHRRLDPERSVVATPSHLRDSGAMVAEPDEAKRERIFDKAERAQKIDDLKAERGEVDAEIAALEEELKTLDDDACDVVRTRIDYLKDRGERLVEGVSELEGAEE